MDFISNLFGYLLNFLYNIFNNYGIAIIIFSVILRIVLLPITIKQQKSMKKNAKMQEEMKKIQLKYGNNPEKLNQETIELYKREKFSPFTGCLSSILQIIIILAVFFLVSKPLTHMKKIDPNVINEYTTKIQQENESKVTSYQEIAIIDKIENEYGEIEQQLQQENIENMEELESKKEELNKYRINMEFLGLDLSKVPTESLNDWRVYIIPILYVITSFVSIKINTNSQKKMLEESKKKEIVVNDDKQDKEKSETDSLESMQQMSNSMMYMMPIMSIMIAIIAPLGLALYWLISNVLMIIERFIIDKVSFEKEEEDVK